MVFKNKSFYCSLIFTAFFVSQLYLGMSDPFYLHVASYAGLFFFGLLTFFYYKKEKKQTKNSSLGLVVIVFVAILLILLFCLPAFG